MLSRSQTSSADDVLVGWKLSALNVVMASSLLLCILVSALTLASTLFLETPVWHFGLSSVFTCAVFVAWMIGKKFHHYASNLLIVLILAAAVAIKLGIEEKYLADLGLIFLYCAPMFAFIFIARSTALYLIAFNFLIFLVLMVSEVHSLQTLEAGLGSGYLYLHFLLFIFFNLSVPLSLSKLIQHAGERTVALTKANKALRSRKALYQALFESSQLPNVIVNLPNAYIVDANRPLKALLGSNWSKRILKIIRENAELLEAGQSFDVKLCGEHYFVRGNQADSKGNYVITVDSKVEVQSLKSALLSEKRQRISMLLEDIETGWPNRQGFLNYLKSRKAKNKVRYLVSFKPERSEYYAREFSKDQYVRFLSRIRHHITSVLGDLYIAKPSQHVLVGLLEVDRGSKACQDVEQWCHLLMAKLERDTDEFSLSTYIGIANLPENSALHGYVLDKTVGMVFSAKQRNYVHKFSIDRDQDEEKILKLRDKLQLAIEHDALTFVFQPKVDRTHQVVEYETLVRWQDGDRLISPNEFIPIAEQFGMVSLITELALRASCSFIHRLMEQNREVDRVSVNLSVEDLQRKDVVKKVLAVLNDHKVPPEKLGIEITETALVQHEEQVQSVLEQMKFWGVHVSIDDFGVGYSSLSRIVDFPIDTLKLDKSFIHNLLDDGKRQISIRSIVRLCHELNIDIVAEGIENLAEKELLDSYGEMYYQGFYFGKPVGAQEILQQ